MHKIEALSTPKRSKCNMIMVLPNAKRGLTPTVNNMTQESSNPNLGYKTTRIKEYPGYAIQSNGTVLKDNHKVNTFIRGKHVFVSLYTAGEYGGTNRCDVKVAKVVAHYFLQKAPYPSAVLLHRDKNRENCSADNLYWGTTEEAKTLYKQPKVRGRMGRKPKDFKPVYSEIITWLFNQPDKKETLDRIAEAIGQCEQTVRRRLDELVRMDKVTVELGKKYSTLALNGRPAYFYALPPEQPLWRLDDYTDEAEFMAQMAAIEEEDRRIDALQKD